MTLLLLITVGVFWGRVLPENRLRATLDRGAASLEAGNPQEAETLWQQALQSSPKNHTALRALAELYRAQGRMEEAHHAFNRFADAYPNEPHLLCTFAEEEMKLSGAGIYEGAVRDALRSAELEPNCIRALTVAGEACIRKGDQKKAIEFLQNAVQNKPEDIPLTLHLINTFLEASDPKGVLPLAEDLMRRYPGYAHGYAMRGIAAGALPPTSPEAKEVEPSLRKALSLDPTNAVAHARLGQYYNAHGEPKRALPHLQSALLLHYDRASLLFQLAQAYRVLGRQSDAERNSAAFTRLSALEDSLSALQKQQAMDAQNATLGEKIKNTQAEIEQARSAFATERSLMKPQEPKPTAPPAGMIQ